MGSRPFEIDVTVSLQQRVLWWIIAVHVAAFAVEFALFGNSLLRSTRQEAIELAGGMVGTLRTQIQPGGGFNAERILSWPDWTRFEDALLLDRNLVQLEDGTIQPQGLALNPLGALARPANFDYPTVYGNLYLAVRTGKAVDDIAGGRVIPIETPAGIWGACWYRVDPGREQTTKLVRSFLGLLAVTTMVLATTLFVVLRRSVLDPVSRLTAMARRVAAGDLSARVTIPTRDDEIGELSRSFNAMVAEVEDFQRRLAEEVRAATDKARTAEQAADAERRLAATGRLASGVAHEINNPLGGLLNAVERLERGDLPPEKRAVYFALLTGGLERIRDTVGKLLRLTPRQASRAPINVAVPTLDAIALVRHRAMESGTVIAISDGRVWAENEPLPESLAKQLAELPRVLGDTNEIGQAVLNLLVNALDAFEAGGAPAGRRRIDVLLRSAYEAGLGLAVTIDVHDNGPGVERGELGKLIDPYYTTKEVGRGTGLGLSLVHSVVTGHGGRWSIDSTPGHGLHVHIALPLAAERS